VLAAGRQDPGAVDGLAVGGGAQTGCLVPVEDRDAGQRGDPLA